MENQLAKGGNSDPMNTARFSNRAARFYWAEEEPSPQRAYSIQQIGKSDSHFEESPLVIAAISAGVIGVAIIIIILVGIWIRSRLYSEVEGRTSQNPNNMSVRSSTSTLEEEAYIVCMEMDGGAVLGSMHNASDNYCENSATLDIENEKSIVPATAVPEILEVDSFSESSPHVIQAIPNDDASESNAKSSATE